jgi:hypothetical protein
MFLVGLILLYPLTITAFIAFINWTIERERSVTMIRTFTTGRSVWQFDTDKSLFKREPLNDARWHVFDYWQGWYEMTRYEEEINEKGDLWINVWGDFPGRFMHTGIGSWDEGSE